MRGGCGERPETDRDQRPHPCDGARSPAPKALPPSVGSIRRRGQRSCGGVAARSAHPPWTRSYGGRFARARRRGGRRTRRLLPLVAQVPIERTRPGRNGLLRRPRPVWTEAELKHRPRAECTRAPGAVLESPLEGRRSLAGGIEPPRETTGSWGRPRAARSPRPRRDPSNATRPRAGDDHHPPAPRPRRGTSGESVAASPLSTSRS